MPPKRQRIRTKTEETPPEGELQPEPLVPAEKPVEKEKKKKKHKKKVPQEQPSHAEEDGSDIELMPQQVEEEKEEEFIPYSEIFDVSHISSSEMGELMSPEKTAQFRSEFRREMEIREQKYTAEHKPATKGPSMKFLGTTMGLTNTAKSLSQMIFSKSEPFDTEAPEIDYRTIPESKPLFNDQLAIIAQSYIEATRQKDTQDDGLSIDTLKTQLGISWFPTPPEPPIQPLEDQIKKINNLFRSARVQISQTIYLIDYTKPEGIQLVEGITFLFFVAAKVPSEFIADTLGGLEKSLTKYPTYSSLASILDQTQSKLPSFEEPTRMFAALIVCLLKQAELSQLISFFAHEGLLRKKLFFADTELIDEAFCTRFVDLLLDIESCKMNGTPDLLQIPLYWPIEPIRIALRIKGVVQELTGLMSIAALSKEDNRAEQLVSLNNLIDTIVQTLSLQTNGSMPNYDEIWSLFYNAAQSTNCSHQLFPKFVQIVNEKSSMFAARAATRMIDAMCDIVNEGVLPGLVVMLQPYYTTVRALENSCVLMSPNLCVKITESLQKISSFTFDLTSAEMKEILKE